jgi:hypothetical protein
LYPPAEIWSATKVGRPSMAIPSGWTVSAWLLDNFLTMMWLTYYCLKLFVPHFNL